MAKITLALVITKPGHLRNGFQSILKTIPQIEIIAESDDPSVLLKMSNELHPELILLDACTFHEIDWAAIPKLKAEWPYTTILFFTENENHAQRAKESGVNYILPKGYLAADLVKLIETLLIQNFEDETN